jgi:hypothetical protein
MDEKTEQYEGGCLCGAVRYGITGPLRPVVACHCRQCQRTSGSFVMATQGDAESLVIQGQEHLRWYESSEEARRGFCSTCGSSLFWRRRGASRISIMAGSLDQPTGLRAEAQIHCDTAGDYYETPADLPQIDQAAIDSFLAGESK